MVRYSNMGHWKLALDMSGDVMRSALKSAQCSAMTIMTNVAGIYREQGDWMNAKNLFVEGLETRLKVFGAEHPQTIMHMSHLPLALVDLGNFQKAEKLQTEILKTSGVY